MTPGDTHTARSRDAIRILFILDQAGSAPSKDDPPGTAKVLQAEKRLQALDFWVRNPDYLAHEYLERFESSGRADADLLAAAAEIMQGDEPELRRLGMLRFMFGAFEAVDTAIAKLASVGMVDVRRRFNAAGNKVTRTDYLLLSPGQVLAAEIAGQPPLDWYARRAGQAAFIAGSLNGGQLKKRQYGVPEYVDQGWGRVIPPIEAKVRARLAELQGR
jgi:hypothetical protein